LIPIGDDKLTQRPPILTVTIILVCLAVFLWQISLGPFGMQRAIYALGMIPAVLLGMARLPPELGLVTPTATIVTSMFMHGGWGHLLGNLLYLWIFGNNVEGRMGHLRFGLFYFGCGALAAAAQILPEPASLVPMVGASGAISGVLGAYLVLFPRANVIVLIPFSFMFVHRIQAVWMLGLWFAFQIFSAISSPAQEGGVAWWAHIGGFVAGMALAWPLRRRVPPRRRGPWG
jgi:membrane associated rhomboid family serine protease